MLCMVMVLSSATSVLADDVNVENTNKAETSQDVNNEPVTASEEADSTLGVTEPPTEDTNITPESTQPTAEQTQPVEEPSQKEEVPVTTETTPVQEALELKQEMKDADGKALCTVTANIPEGTFNANTSEVSMEVKDVEAVVTEEIKTLMEKGLAENKMLGDYFSYKISFKVNGETVEPGHEIKITFEKKDFKIGDTKKANVFYYNEAYSTAGNEAAEILEITQKSEKIEELQNAGQSIDNIDDYDLTEITLKEDGTADKIQTEGRRSTIYGCYIEEDKPEEVPAEENQPTEEETTTEEKPAEVMNYENDDAIITVSADKEGVIPANSKLQVVPILQDDKETETKYKEVEEQLNKKAENEEYDIAGFLAYDISFVNEDGKEVEPNGDVKVTIDYKNEVLPDGVDENKDLDVTVMHLEENGKGDVKEVVDMVADTTKEAAVETTEQSKVKKAEFITDSFSAFTITWTLRTGTKRINVKILDSSRYEIDVDKSCAVLDGITLSQSEEFLMKDITEKGRHSKFYTITDTNGIEYIFSKVVNDWDWQTGKEEPDAGSDVVGLRYSNNQVQWKKAGSNNYTDYNSKDAFYFIYTKKPSSIQKVSTESDNIDISLYNYSRLINDSDYNSLKNAGFGFYASVEAKDGSSTYSGTYTNSGTQGILQDIVRRNLKDGKPVLNNRNRSSMGFLFGTGYNKAVTKHENLSGLFQKDANGYYYYDSLRNAAVLNGNNIDVYDGTVSALYDYGNFFPFNNEYLRNGTNQLNKIASKDVDMWFGMNVGMSFYQPKDGRINNQDMVFEFRGDDDVWVFIDGMLVLDIGGIHAKKDGSINFRTGEVKVDGKKTTLAECYKKAYEERSMTSGQIATQLASLFNKNNGVYTSFKNYSSHKLEFFYMERGGGASNCKIKFNMPRIPEGSVMVTKEVVNENKETVDYSENIDFHFNIKKNGSILANKPYILYENNVKTGTGETDADGNFVLKHGQSAVFEGFKVTDKYEIKEFGAYLNGYEITYNGKILLQDTESEGITEIYSATTEELGVDQTSSVVFRNTVKETAVLLIKKELAEGSRGLADKEFPIQVMIQGKAYKGSYTKNGLTYTTENGNLKIKAGETIQITGLPYGTSFDIKEQLDGSYLPTYSISGDVYDKMLPEYDNEGVASNNVTSASAKIAGDTPIPTVTIKNREVEIGTGTTSVKVTKSWKDAKQYEVPEYVNVTLYQDVNSDGVFNEDIDTLVAGMETKALNADNDWTCEWTNLPADVDFVVKETYPEGFELFQTTITNSITAVEPIGEKNSPNSSTVFNLGKNNILLVKETSNSGYFLWTPRNLGLTQTEINKIVQLIKPKLTGAGNLGNNVIYKYGDNVSGGISLSKNDSGWTLSFSKTSTWSLFWNFSYNRVQHIHLENTVDNDLKTKIELEKIWQGDTQAERPESITVQLYKNGVKEGSPIVVTHKQDWRYTFEDLDYYYYNSKTDRYIKNEYDIKETKIGDATVDVNGQAADYQSSVKKNEDGSFTITNTKQWQILKVSDQSNELILSGAVFKLWTGNAADTPIYGKSDENGELLWYKDLGLTELLDSIIPNGTYTLTEEQAPIGYLISNEIWTITFDNGTPASVASTKGSIEEARLNGKMTYYYKNTAVYDLPNAGGSGIYWYSISGMLLMIAAALILYKNKCKEVLKS